MLRYTKIRQWDKMITMSEVMHCPEHHTADRYPAQLAGVVKKVCLAHFLTLNSLKQTHSLHFSTPLSLNKHHLLLSFSLSLVLPPSHPLLQPLFVSLLPISLFSTHISLCDSQVLCCATELRSLPAISTLHLWNPSWLPQPFTVEGCHLPHGGAGRGTKEAPQRTWAWGLG